jgi:hypothetical protein
MLACFTVAGQTYVTKDTTFDGWIARITYVVGRTDSTNAFIIMHGNGEIGPGNETQVMGPHYWMNNGWDGTVTLGNGVHYPVWVTLQQPTTQNYPTTLKPKYDAIKARFKVKEGGLHLMGISGGAWSNDMFVTYKANSTDYTYYNYARTVTNIQGVKAGDPNGSGLGHPQRFGNVANVNTGFKYLGFEQAGDNVRDVDYAVKNVIDSAGAGRAYYYITNFGSGGHSNFNDFYNPNTTNWTMSNPDVQLNHFMNVISTTPFAGGQNIYQWALRQSRDTTLGGVGSSLAVNAGTDHSITLPVNFTTLTAVPSGGTTPYTYAWAQLSGPNTATVVTPSAISTSVTGMIEGTYVFRVTVIDNVSATISDNVEVIVAPAFVPGINTMLDVATGEYAVNWIKNNGLVYAINGSDNGYTVQQVSGLSNIIEGRGGQYNTVLRNSSGQVFSVLGGQITSTAYPTDNLGNPFTCTYVDGIFRNIVAIKGGEIYYWSAAQTTPAGNEDLMNQYGGVAQLTPRKLIQPAGGKVFTKVQGFTSTSYGSLTYMWGLASDGTIWQWDRTHTTPFQVTGWGPSNNARNFTLGAFSFVIETTTDQIWAWGYRADLVGAQASWQNPNPQNITSVWTGAGVNLPLKQIQGTYNTVMVIDANDELFGMGSNSGGEIGNGPQWPSWRTYPSNSSAPYAGGWTLDDVKTIPPVQVPGKWLNIKGNNSVAFYMYGQDMNANWYSWGRGKARVLGNGIAQTSAHEAAYPHYYNIPAPRLVTPLTQTWTVNAGAVNANRTPIASAGINQYLTNGTTSTTLYGSGSHQQQPTHGATTITMTNAWTKTSGASCTITSPTAQNTTVTGMTAGEYVFRNTVTSSYGVNYQEVTVVIQTSNLPPVADAGATQSITLPANSVSVNGSGTDPDGTIASYAWTKISGSSGTTIASPSAQSTLITFTTADTYVFRLTVTDDDGSTAIDDVAITVYPAPAGRQVFKIGKFKWR